MLLVMWIKITINLTPCDKIAGRVEQFYHVKGIVHQKNLSFKSQSKFRMLLIEVQGAASRGPIWRQE